MYPPGLSAPHSVAGLTSALTAFTFVLQPVPHQAVLEPEAKGKHTPQGTCFHITFSG